MIPIRDSIQTTDFPWVTSCIISTCIVATITCWFLPAPWQETYIRTMCVMPADYDPFPWDRPWEVYRFVTAIFIHRSPWHLTINMVFLKVFGESTEEAFGKYRFLCFYLLCGFLSYLFQVIFQMNASSFNMGSSGADAAVLGAYFVVSPRARIMTFFPYRLPLFIYLPAFMFFGLWLFYQFWMGIVGKQGVAWWAHAWGFGLGIILRFVFIQGKRKKEKVIVW